MLGAYLFVSILKFSCAAFTWTVSASVSQDFGGRKSQGRAPADLVPCGAVLPPWPSSHCVFLWQRGQGALWSPFYKGIDPFHAYLLIQERDPGLIPGWGRSPGGGNGNALQYSCLENPRGQRSLVGYSPWGLKESDSEPLVFPLISSTLMT